MIKSNLILLFVLLTTVSTSIAQTWDLGGFIGASSYMGDLNPVDPLKVKNPAWGLQLKRCFNPYWALKLSFNKTKIEAYDAESKDPNARQRGLSFFSPITEVSLQTEFNFFSYVPSLSKKLYTPFIYAGLGVAAFDPQRVLGNQTYHLRDYGTEGQSLGKPYRDYTIILPLGAGIKYNFAGKWSLIAELGYRKAYSDYLDDVSKNYMTTQQASSVTDADMRNLRAQLADPTGVGVAGVQRGDYRKRDSYFIAGISITYSIFKKGCPVVAY